VNGWKPEGVDGKDHLAYAGAFGQTVSTTDADALSTSLRAALASVPDEEVPLGGGDFGEDHTRSLLEQAALGTSIAEAGTLAAVEILSGSPKKEAWELADFMAGGAFTIHPGSSR